MLSLLFVCALALTPEKVNESKLSQASQENTKEISQKPSFALKNKIKEPSKSVKSRSVIMKQKKKKAKKKKEKNIKEKIGQVMVDTFVKHESPTPIFTGTLS